MKSRVATILLILLLSTSCGAEEPTDKGVELYNRIGLSIGTPAGLNAVVVVETKWTNLYLSGLRSQRNGDEAKGIQAGISLLRFKEDKDFIALNLIGGASRLNSDEWDFWGVDGTVTWGWVFLQPGLTFGTGTYESPQLSLQFGVLIPL